MYVSGSVMSDSLLPHAPLSMGILQARMLEWSAISFSSILTLPKWVDFMEFNFIRCMVGFSDLECFIWPKHWVFSTGPSEYWGGYIEQQFSKCGLGTSGNPQDPCRAFIRPKATATWYCSRQNTGTEKRFQQLLLSQTSRKLTKI